MEIFLNLVWLAVAVALVTCWVRSAGGPGTQRRQQLIAVLLLVAILFPVISVSDDLIAVQNTAESDNCTRRDSILLGIHPLVPLAISWLPSLLLAASDPPAAFVSRSGEREALKPASAHFPAVQNRPPPCA